MFLIDLIKLNLLFKIVYYEIEFLWVKYRPQSWPQVFWAWENLSNPSQKQKIKLPDHLKLVHLMKETIHNRLKLKGDSYTSNFFNDDDH